MSAIAHSTAAAIGAPRAVKALRRTNRRAPATKIRASASPAASGEECDVAPQMPIVIIDNTADPLATIVEVSFGDVLGQLLDTCEALKALGLNINRADISGDCDNPNRFYLTDAKTSEKITKSAKIEQIRLTVIDNMLKYHPEAAEYLVEGQPIETPGAREPDANPLGVRPKPKVKTLVSVEAVGDRRSKVTIETTDRPGLLMDIVKNMKDLSLNVVSAEIDTVGPKAKDVIYVTYRGGALNESMVQLLINSLTYYLTLREVASAESY